MTPTQLANFAWMLATHRIRPDDVPWHEMSERDKRELLIMTAYELERLVWRRGQRLKAQRKALKLLRSLLTPSQRAQLRSSRCFVATGTSGGTYRLWPGAGRLQRVERHGSRWFAKVSYCIHDPDELVPPADASIGHLLLLSTDELKLTSDANVRILADQLWNGDYLRWVNEGRRERATLAERSL